MGLAWIAAVVMVVVMCLVYVLPKLTTRIGLVDEPDSRKQHEGRIPLVGGLAMFCGFVVGMSLLFDRPWMHFPSLIFGGLLLIVVGVFDDLFELRKRARISAQVAAALMMIVVGGIVLSDLGWLAFGDLLTLGLLAIPFTTFCVIGVVNAVNMSDGLDGLAGGLAFITFGALAYLAYDASGPSADFNVLVVLMACLAGFLAFNARSPWCRKVKVFMGDAGSMFLGFAIARFLIDFSQGDARIIHPVSALWIFAVPLMDTVAVMLRRVKAGQSPFAADRQHLHHVLLAAGLTVGQTVVAIWALALLFAAAGVVGYLSQVPDAVMFWGFLSLFGIYTWVLSHLGEAAARRAPARPAASATESGGQS